MLELKISIDAKISMVDRKVAWYFFELFFLVVYPQKLHQKITKSIRFYNPPLYGNRTLCTVHCSNPIFDGPTFPKYQLFKILLPPWEQNSVHYSFHDWSINFLEKSLFWPFSKLWNSLKSHFLRIFKRASGVRNRPILAQKVSNESLRTVLWCSLRVL